MYNGEDIKQQREARANNIVKGFSNSDDLLEKAHNHGDIHPNGKWYWESSANGGKGDWRTIKLTPAATADKPKAEEKQDDKPKYKKETEKAVMLTLIVEAEIAPKGGFTSSMVKDRTYVWDVWIPKTQLSEDGKPSKWITNKKIEEILDKKVYNAQILSSSGTYKDENGKLFSAGETEQEKNSKKNKKRRKKMHLLYIERKLNLLKN